MRIPFYVLVPILFLSATAAQVKADAVSPGHRPQAALDNGQSAAAALSPADTATGFICPMHPFIHGHKGDHCPICGMELVSAADRRNPDQSDQGTINISPAYIQALGVKTAQAAYHKFGQAIHSYGHIVPNMRTEYQASLRKGGWIKDLNASAVGDTVKAGDVLFTFFSPELVAIESEYLTGIKSGLRVTATDQRLRLYGMDEQAIALFKRKGEVIENVPFHAQAGGIVTALNARKGSYVAEGNLIMTIQDFSQVWVEAHVLLKDLQFVNVGTPATVIQRQTGEQYKATVDFISPMADMDNKEGMARLILDNPAGKLKTDEPVDIMFTADSQPRFAVPEQAVLYSGMGAYVIEDLGGGSFRPVMVKTGITADGMTEITSGLTDKQFVVTTGQFMLDAESNLSGGGMGNMSGMDMGPSHGK